MASLQLLYFRNRRLATRLAALMALVIGIGIAMLPLNRADAHGRPSPRLEPPLVPAMLLSRTPLARQRDVTLTLPVYR